MASAFRWVSPWSGAGYLCFCCDLVSKSLFQNLFAGCLAKAFVMPMIVFLFKICYGGSKAQVGKLTVNGQDWEPITVYTSPVKCKSCSQLQAIQ